MVKVVIDTEVEAYPVLSIREGSASDRPTEIEIPAALMARLNEAERQVDAAELEIMRYVAERWPYASIREWLDDHDEKRA